MSAIPPAGSGSSGGQPSPSAGAPAVPDLDDPAQLVAAVREVSLRLLGGGVQRSTMTQLQKLARDNVGDYPWRDVTRRILAEPIDEQRLVQQALVQQRDWIWRGGRETPGPGIGYRTKGFFAKLVAQTIFLSIWALVLAVTLLALKHKFGFDLYQVLEFFYSTFPSLKPQ